MTDPQKQKVLWFIDFAQMDLGALGPGDRVQLNVEVEEYLFPVEETKLHLRLWAEVQNKTRYSRKSWVDDLPEKGTEAWWEILGACKTAIHSQLLTVAINPDAKGFGSYLVSPALVGMKVDTHIRLSVQPLTKKFRDMAMYRLYQALDGLPRSALLQCQQCKGIFLNLTRRKKKFCSNLCQSRHSASQYRKKHRDKYNKKQQEIMRKVSAKKKKSEG